MELRAEVYCLVRPAFVCDLNKDACRVNCIFDAKWFIRTNRFYVTEKRKSWGDFGSKRQFRINLWSSNWLTSGEFRLKVSFVGWVCFTSSGVNLQKFA